MKPPIFVVCTNDDIYAYGSVADAEAALESIDVEDGEYRAAFDATGMRLTVGVVEPTRRSRLLCTKSHVMTPVRILPASSPGEGADELRELLGAKLADARADLASLVARAGRELAE